MKPCGRTLSITLLHLLMCAGVLLVTQTADAAIELRSTFDLDAEGWSVLDWQMPYPGGGIANTYDANYAATGGSPGGHIWFSDTDPNFSVFGAPGKYLGNKLGYLGQTVSVDLATPLDDFPKLMMLIHSTDRMLGAESNSVPTDFEHFEVVLDASLVWTSMWEMETDGNWGNLTGAPTHDDFVAVLSDLVGLYIAGDHHNEYQLTKLDNFVMTPEPATLLVMAAAGLPVLLRRRRHRNRPELASPCRELVEPPLP